MNLDYIVTPSQSGITLDHLLRSYLGFSAAQARHAKRIGVTSDGILRFGNQPVYENEHLCIPLSPYPQETPTACESLPAIQALYEDKALLAVFKPALLQCHPSPSAPRGSDTLEARVQQYLGAPAHPVHRLDAETTGPVLFAKLPYVQAHIQRQMETGDFQKTYQAWVFGLPTPMQGVIDAPIALSQPDSFTRVVREDGQRAVSRYTVIQSLQISGIPISLVELHPETGRTHQLRVHMAHIGCPLLGDARYATERSKAFSDSFGLSYHQLSAIRLRFLHPLSGLPVEITSDSAFSFHPEFL